MIGSENLLAELQRLIKRAKTDGISVCAHGQTRRVSRFAMQRIHQDILQESITVYVKMIANHRVGLAVTDSLERASVDRAFAAAVEIARHAPLRQDIPDLPKGNRQLSREAYYSETATAPAEQFITTLKRLFQICQGAGAELAGSFVLGEDELAVANSNGTACYAASTISGAKLVTMYRKLSGFATGVHRDLRQLDLERLLEHSLKQCLHRRDPVLLPTVKYEVILEPEAVAELMVWLGYIAFGAKSFKEGTSFLSGRMGERVVAPSITIYDDGQDPAGLTMPFDFEGVPKQQTALIEQGKAAGIVYDTTYGKLYGHPSTGHALSPDDIEGPLPSNLFVAPGTTPREELIRRCRRGLLIPRFHYVSGLLNPREALMTGLTREGAFLIENGKLAAPIGKMRFTQSLLEALNHVRGISRERECIADPAQDFGASVMPTLHLAKFRFTGRSEGSP